MLLRNQRTNSLQKIGDADADSNYSLIDYSYSDTPVNKSSSFDEINVSALNEPQSDRFDNRERKEEAKEQKRKQSCEIRIEKK